MQGLESLNQFQNFVSSLGGLGRYEDTYMIHAAEGETVIPMEVLDRNPVLKKRLFKSMKALGIDPGRYIVGNDLNSINPVTGQPEFFLKKIFKRIKKGIADVSGYAAPVIGAMYGPAAGALAGAAMGSFKRENPGDPSQWQQMAMRGGLSGLAANVAGGQNPFMGTGLQHGTGTWNPWKIGKHYLSPDEPGATPWSDYFKTGKTGDTDREWKFMEEYFGEKETASQMNDKVLTEKSRLMAKDPTLTSDGALQLAQSNTSNETGVPIGKIIKWGLALGALEKYTSEDEDIGDKYEYAQTGEVYDPILNPQLVAEGGIVGYRDGGFSGSPYTEGPFYRGKDEGFAPDIPDRRYGMKELEMWRDFLFRKEKEYFQPKEDEEKMRHLKELMKDPEFKRRIEEKIFGTQTLEAAHGGIMDLQGGGFSQGPGTGTSDSIPAMLSDGEFVMTAEAVRGAGGGNRREGARKMYETMDRLEARV